MKNRFICLSDITYGTEEEQAILDVLRSKWISMGDVTRTFEKEFGEYVGSPHAIAVTNCTAALHLALVALGLGAGDEVIVPSLTFVATVNAIRYTGAAPVFADIKGLDDWTVGGDNIRKLITPSTRAIMVMHYGGFPCDMKTIKEIANENKLYLIEDAAHGPGSWFESEHIGTMGDIGCFSLFANKNMTTGEGGVLVTANDELGEKMKYMRSHGMTSLSYDRHMGHAHQYDVVSLGFNYRFDDMRAALARVQLKKLPLNNQKRSERYGYYIDKLEKVSGVRIPFKGRKERVSYHLFPVLLDENIDRLELMKKMRDKGVQTSIHYLPVHLFSACKDLCSENLPNTEIVGRRELTLPLHPLLKYEDIDYVIKVLKKCLHDD